MITSTNQLAAPSPETPREQSETAVAFSLGSDARLAGRTLDANPFNLSTEWSLAYAWVIGWQHVHTHWGADVKGRWFFPALAEVSYRKRE